MATSSKEVDSINKSIVISSKANPIDNESTIKKKSALQGIRSIQRYKRNVDEDSSDDDRNEIADIIYLSEISTVKRKEDKFYQYCSPIGNGIYDGTLNEKFSREGQGTFSINNGEEYYSGSWKDDKPHGYGYQFKNYGSIIFHGEFQNGILKQGYGKEKLIDGYQYEGKIENGKFSGLGCLSIEVKDLRERNNIHFLKVVAEWREGKTSLIYSNEIEEYYLNQYEVFCHSLESIILLDNENRQNQREYLQIFLDLTEKRLSNLSFLNEIALHSSLPSSLKHSADLLHKLDHTYTNLNTYTQAMAKKTYIDCTKDICYKGLKIYTRRFAWSNEDDKIDCISSKDIFQESLNNFLMKSQLSELKMVLSLNPSVVDLIRKLISLANLRLNRVPSQNQSHFIDFHHTFLKNIWKNYFENPEYRSISNKFDDQNHDKYQFYSDCYSNFLELSFLNQFEIEIDLKRLEDNQTDTSIEVKLNGEIVFSKTTNHTDSDIQLIVFDGMIPQKLSEQSFIVSYNDDGIHDLIRFVNEKINPENILAVILPFNASKNVNGVMKRLLKRLDSNKINFLVKDMAWVGIKRKNSKEIYEKMSNAFERELTIKQTFQLKLNEDLLMDENMTRDRIEAIIYKAMTYVLNHFKPWENFPKEKLSSYFNQPIDQEISIKEIGDRLLIKILQDCKQEILAFLEAKNVSFDNKNNESFSKHFQSMIEYYQESLLNDKTLNYQVKMKEIRKILDYFLQIITNHSSRNEDMTELQLESLKEFIQEKQIITELIDHFLQFNKGFSSLSQTFDKHFPSNIHPKFHQSASQIISLLTEIFKLILQPKQMVDQKEENCNQFVNKLYAMQKINNFLTNLESLDISWFVEGKDIKHLSSHLFEEKGEHQIYKVLNIEQARLHVTDPSRHYVLEAIIDLLMMIKDLKIVKQVDPIEFIAFRAELIMAIGRSLKYFNDQIKYNSLAKFKDDCVNPFGDLIEDIQSYSVFCQKLEKVDLYFLYNRKLKEIDLKQALHLFQEKNAIYLRSEKIEKAFTEYEKIFRTYLSNVMTGKTYIKNITKETKEIAKKNGFNRETIPHIIAGLSVVLSLTTSDFIAKNSDKEYVLKKNCKAKYLLQPHCIQILGVFMLLNIDNETNSIPPNHLAEILTGQGKSWALALLAGFFSLTDYQVTIACYSDYLSRRDQKDFFKNFEPFQLTNYISYQTFDSMCDKEVANKDNTKTDLRHLVLDIVSGNELPPQTNQKNEKSKSILLIDEVDVFFSKNFGKMYNPVVRIPNKQLAQIQKGIWQALMNGEVDKTQLKHLVDFKVVSLMKEDKMLSTLVTSNFFKSHMETMINTGIQIYEDMKSKNARRDKYKLIDEKIHRKNSDGKYVSHIYNSYENSFYYLKLKYDKDGTLDQLPLDNENYGYLLVYCGTISYSELPNSYQGIFGVSGSLKDLSPAEESLLTHYHIEKRSYYPSFFGYSKLKFHPIQDFIIQENKQEWFNYIIIQARERLTEERSVLIFFDTEEILDEFYKRHPGDLGVVPFFLTQNKIFDGKDEKTIYRDSDVNKLIKDEYAGHQGKVTLLTKEFGRGVDFQSETKVNEKGGIHVIQTFFSADVKEEVQIKGRTARKDELGSYELVLCLDHLSPSEIEGKQVSIFTNITKSSTYAELDQQRREKTDFICKNKFKQMTENQESHKKTLMFYKKALTECHENNRQDFITQIMQLRS